MGWAAWRVAALGCLGAACIETVPVRTIDGAQSGLLILEDGDRRRVIAFEGRTTVPIGPEITRAAILSLACPLETYGIPEAELEFFEEGEVQEDYRALPSPLEIEPLELVSEEPFGVARATGLVLPITPPWAELPMVDGSVGQRLEYFDAIGGAAFGDLLAYGGLSSPFTQEPRTWEGGEAAEIEEIAWAPAPRGPQGQARAAVLVETDERTREIRVVERGEGSYWRTATTFPVPRVSDYPLGLAASWREPTPQFLILSEDHLQWTQGRGGWAARPLDTVQGNVRGLLVGAVPHSSGWSFSLQSRGVRTFRLDDGKVGLPTPGFIAESQDGGWWTVYGAVRRWTKEGRSAPVDGPPSRSRDDSKQLAAEHEGALLTWNGGDVVYWPAERCARPWRWPAASQVVVHLALTDAYVARVVWVDGGYRREWRARPDRTPTDPLE